jgi:hypothetical protein
MKGTTKNVVSITPTMPEFEPASTISQKFSPLPANQITRHGFHCGSARMNRNPQSKIATQT